MRSVFICIICLFFATTVMAAEINLAEKNLIDLHLNAKLSSKECLKCHESVMKDVTGTKKFKVYHKVHLESKLSTPRNCTECHWKTDLRNGSAVSLRKQVDPQLCTGCHSGGVKGANVLFAYAVVDEKQNLVDMHKDAAKLGTKDCLECHEGILKGEVIKGKSVVKDDAGKKSVVENKKFKIYHRVHLESKNPAPRNCTECHWSVDLRNGSTASLRKQVDPQLCNGCHSGGIKDAKSFYVQQ